MLDANIADIPTALLALKQHEVLRQTASNTPSPSQRALEAIEKDRPVALAYDGSFEALLSCIYVAFAARNSIEDIALGNRMQMRLGVQVVPVETDMDAARRVQRSIIRSLGENVWRAVILASASDDSQKGMALYRFLRASLTPSYTGSCKTCKQRKTCATSCSHIPPNNFLDQWDNPEVEPFLALQRQVLNEIENMRQFIRFEHVEGDLWFAQCNPSCSVVPFIMGHFGRRFNTQRFAIYDEVHHLAGISENGHWQLIATDSIAPPPHSREEAGMQDAWRRFYRALSIDERYNPELRRNFMPKRLWRNITEVKHETT